MLLSDGILETSEKIQILRAKTPLKNSNYLPILDWYYCDEVMEDMFHHSLAISETDLLETKEFQRKYLAVSRSLKQATVGECLIEFREYLELLKTP